MKGSCDCAFVDRVAKYELIRAPEEKLRNLDSRDEDIGGKSARVGGFRKRDIYMNAPITHYEGDENTRCKVSGHNVKRKGSAVGAYGSNRVHH